MVVTARGICPMKEHGREIYEPLVYHTPAISGKVTVHTRLELQFDWEKEQVGKATLRLKPFSYPTETVTLDARDHFHQVSLEGNPKLLKYEYDGKKPLNWVGLLSRRKYHFYRLYGYFFRIWRGSKYHHFDRACSSSTPEAKKLGNLPNMDPGETEFNGFQTIDKPNERCTQEMIVMVEND